MFNSTHLKKAWEIRREAAKEIGCGVMQVAWKVCLEMAREVKEEIDFEELGNVWQKHGKNRLYLNWSDLNNELDLDYRLSKVRKLNSEVKFINLDGISTTEELRNVLLLVADTVAFARAQSPIRKYVK